MSFWTYLLRCRDGSYYVGHTDDLERRIGEHQHGRIVGYTSNRRPVSLLWSQDFATREEALAAERQIKRWSRAKKEALVSSDWTSLQAASKKRFLLTAHPLDTPALTRRHSGRTG